MELWIKILLWIVPVIFAVTLHEIAHGWVASLLGDSTARDKGRLSLNPLKHVDPVGSIAVPGVLLIISGFVFGWAKPVPVNAQQLRHPKRDMGLVALAGPLANFAMAIFWAFTMKAGLALLPGFSVTGSVLIYIGAAGIFINTALMMLNLLPLPPLDGGRVLVSVLPETQAIWLLKLEKWGLLILVLLLLSGVATKFIWPMVVLGMALTTHLTNIPSQLFTESLTTLFN